MASAQKGPTIVPDATLPSGWLCLEDPGSGRRYFYQQATGVVQWDRPTGGSPSSLQPSSTGVHTVASNGSYESSGPLSNTEYLRRHDLRVVGEGPHDICPPAVQTFEAAGFSRDILDEVRRAGFSAPTPIQAQSWPVAMGGRDLVAIAKTGSGKTCGFLLPGMMHIAATRKDPRCGPTVLVLAPTRELAVQIKQEADKFGRTAGIRNTCVYGGAPKGPQLRDLSFGVHICIATPGRLNDFLEARQVRLEQVSYLVLDEADRMLDMGFEPQIQRIVRQLPAHRQTLFFSATWPREVKTIASQFVTNHPVHVFVGAVEEKLVANKSITQHIVLVNGLHEKSSQLVQLLRRLGGHRTIVFCSTKRTCDQLAMEIGREFRAAAIHGDKRQQERDYALAAFKDGRMPVLVATDVAARGLDIKDVKCVVNFDFPASGVEDYIHRIGRTGRAGATGDAYTFFSSGDARHARQLITVLTDAGQHVPPELEQMARFGGGGGGGGSRRYGGGGGGGGGYGGGGGFGGGRSGGYGSGGVTGSNMIPLGTGAGSAYGSAVGGYSGAGNGGGFAGSYGGGYGAGSRERERSPVRDRRRSPAYGRSSPRR